MTTVLTRFVAFDLETDGLIDSDNYPRVLCGAAAKLENGEVLDVVQWQPINLESVDPMSNQQLAEMTRELWDMHSEGWVLCGWNTLGFDLRVLDHHLCDFAEERELLRRMALSHVDPMFNIFKFKGFPIKLQAVAEGFKLDENKSWDGVQAIEAWKSGDAVDRRKVVDYCCQDTRVTGAVIAALQRNGHLKWKTKGSERRKSKIAEYLPSAKQNLLAMVKDTYDLPAVDNSWMRKKPSDTVPVKENFGAWLFV